MPTTSRVELSQNQSGHCLHTFFLFSSTQRHSLPVMLRTPSRSSDVGQLLLPYTPHAARELPPVLFLFGSSLLIELQTLCQISHSLCNLFLPIRRPANAISVDKCLPEPSSLLLAGLTALSIECPATTLPSPFSPPSFSLSRDGSCVC